MADHKTCPPLAADSIRAAYPLISPYIHQTPVLRSKTLDRIASTAQEESAIKGTAFEGQKPATPVFRLYFKCENFQRIGAFKARGAFHAVLRLCSELGIDQVRKRGVTTHSSGNHAQALALAAFTLNIPAHIVMPSISTKSKIAGTRAYNARVLFSGSTEPERVAMVEGVIKETGTAGLELEKQVEDLLKASGDETTLRGDSTLNAVITPLGGGGLLAGTATYFSSKPSTYVFGAEPSFEGGDDGRRGLACGSRISTVSTLTIADGLRTPVGQVSWTVISDQKKVRGVFAVTEEQTKEAMTLILERLKVFIEPSAAVPFAVILFDEEFRQIVEKEGGEKGWDVGVILSGGNTTVEAICRLYGEK
ncbi:hypothetical protein N7497_005037 [Penicillium chrysogenum]|uniref:Tryptophan synthase beta chain-like PALP domain-containing protein n=1 Tax=Penicillium chrysogenum TaxID=5076 RepID=A0ABQ8WP34_PENCH|nr:hypothetical protein N7505_002978 [Penicillium chrysogenum]KAJ5284928.1 hypothetical protein N7524_000234 [Penicillium chrysogenum]KAJ6156152.1 hypothetical protein N7497_005037 [Penicillium chrysogenum]